MLVMHVTKITTSLCKIMISMLGLQQPIDLIYWMLVFFLFTRALDVKLDMLVNNSCVIWKRKRKRKSL